MKRITAEGKTEALKHFRQGDWLWLIGTVLYWAEGTKPKPWLAQQVEFTNADPEMILLAREWLTRSCSVSASSLRYSLYIHERANIVGARRVWMKLLDLPPDQLHMYFKKHNPRPRRRNTGENYHGTMRVYVRRSTDLNRRVAGWIQGLKDCCGVG